MTNLASIAAFSDGRLRRMPEVTASPESLAVKLEREITAGRIELPVLPTLVHEVQALIERDAALSFIVAAVEKEPAIAAGLVKYANAAVYTGLREVTEIGQAMLRLGLKSVREVVVSLSAANAFHTKEPTHRAFYQTVWEHALTTAVAARRLAAFAAVPKETAFLAGLLHDIGRIVVFGGIHALRQRDPEGITVPEHTVAEFTDALHCRMGEVLCQTWNVPASLTHAVAHHHDAEIEAKDALTAIVQIADLMASKIGVGLHPDTGIKLLDRPSFSALQLDDVKVAAILIDLEDQREMIRQAF
jgi:putative nucleotidyltransferase with HDIG domain